MTGPNAAERLAILTALLAGIGWVFTKALPAMFSRHNAAKTAKLIRLTRLERNSGRMKRTLLVLISAVEMGVSVDRLAPYVRDAKRLMDEIEREEDNQKPIPLEPPKDLLP